MLTLMSISSVSNDMENGINVHGSIINDADGDCDDDTIMWLYPIKICLLC
jgi:hypothetical protein